MNYLASPPLVVAYAIAGRMDADLVNDPLGEDQDGKPVFLKDIWPSAHEIQDFIRTSVTSEMFARNYQSVYEGDDMWKRSEERRVGKECREEGEEEARARTHG